MRGGALTRSLLTTVKDRNMETQGEKFPVPLLWFAGVAMTLLCASSLLVFSEHRQSNAATGWTGDIVKVIDGVLRPKRRS
jgi:hypothetical protein